MSLDLLKDFFPASGSRLIEKSGHFSCGHYEKVPHGTSTSQFLLLPQGLGYVGEVDEFSCLEE